MTRLTTNPETPGATELLLVRHGQSEANAGTSTEPDCALSELGRKQAHALARRLAALDLTGFVALTSPYRRALQTAEEVALATGLSFTVDEALREWGPTATVGGRTYAQEPVTETVRRLERFLRDRAGQRLLVVSHGAPIALLTQLAWGETPTTEGQFWTGVSNCCSRWVKTTCAPWG
jgi:broad specificity phosphatase PhoE